MSDPTKEEWRQLYDLAGKINKLAPWQLLMEDEIFGVQDPTTNQMGFVSIMGAAGEYLAVGVYRGVEGLHGFLDIEFSDELMEGGFNTDILEVPQLQLSFEDRESITPEDRAIMKQLGLKFRGRRAWPMFRSTQPGWLPWNITSEEARFMITVLQQVIEFIPRVRELNNFFDGYEEHRFLVRVSRQQGHDQVWVDELMYLPPPELNTFTEPLDQQLLAAYKKLPTRTVTVELDVFNLLSPVISDNGRPYFSYMLLLVDARSGMIIGKELLSPEPSLSDLKASVPNQVLQRCIQDLRFRPSRFHVGSEDLFARLKPFAEQTGTKIDLKEELPALDEAMMSLIGFLGGLAF